MLMQIATVEGPVIGKSNQLSCRIDGGEVVPVTYTTPYGGWRTGDEDSVGGGFVAIPEPRSEVIILKPNADSGWYYSGTILSSNDSAQSEGGEDPIKEHEPTKNIGGEEINGSSPITGYRWIPQRMAMGTVKGNEMILSDSTQPGENGEEGKSASFSQIHTPDNKKISAYTTDDNDSIEMETMYHDRIKLTQDEVDNAGAQELHIETESNQNYHCETGKIWIEVTEGLDVDIRNNSGGASKIPVSEEEFGNINLISRNMDINLTAEGRKEFIGNGTGENYVLGSNVSGYDASTSYVDAEGNPIDPMEDATVPEVGGSIFIQALGEDNNDQMIQIYSKDKLMVYGTGDVWIKGDKVWIQSDDKLDISAQKDISIHTPGNIKMDAAQIHLNGGFSYADPNIAGKLEDNHLGVGKTEPGDEPIKVEWLQPPEEE